MLTRFALERLLYRLSISPHREQFLLKGALLFDLWFDEPHRPTPYDEMFRLASKHGLGFVDASGNGAVWFPKSDGQLELLHEHEESDPLGRMARIMAERHGAVQIETMEHAVTQITGMLGDPQTATLIVISGEPLSAFALGCHGQSFLAGFPRHVANLSLREVNGQIRKLRYYNGQIRLQI